VIREYVYGRAAVSPQQGKFSALVLPGVDAEARAVFLAPTSADFPGAYGLLLDGAGGHRAVARRVPPPLRLLPLPPYSPELNPLEHLGDHRRENCFGNRVFPSLRGVPSYVVWIFRHGQMSSPWSTGCLSAGNLKMVCICALWRWI